MKRVFADTHYFLGLLNERDSCHELARHWTERLADDLIITTPWVLTELADGMCQPHHRRVCADFLKDIEENGTMRVLGGSPGHWQQGFALYRSRPDKEWSLTDCISFVVMAEEGLTEALTGDHHFEQAGFVALLDEKP